MHYTKRRKGQPDMKVGAMSVDEEIGKTAIPAV
jgi:hypothetical protein